jgi:hypothetical protein
LNPLRGTLKIIFFKEVFKTKHSQNPLKGDFEEYTYLKNFLKTKYSGILPKYFTKL